MVIDGKKHVGLSGQSDEDDSTHFGRYTRKIK